MTMDHNDVAADARAAQLFDEWLDESMTAATEIARLASSSFSDRDRPIEVTAEWGTDGPDDPAIVFVVCLELADDFDPDEWPGDLVAAVKAAVRRLAVEKLPDGMPFYVVVSQRAPTPSA